MKIQSSLLFILTSASLVGIGFSQTAADILSDVGKFKAKITFTDAYADKVTTVPSGDPTIPATHQTDPTEHLSASLTANLGNVGFDFAEIADSMAVEVTVGGFDYSASLVDSIPLDSMGNPKFSFDTSAAKHTSATFNLTTDVLDKDGNPITNPVTGLNRQRNIGNVKFAWNMKTGILTVTVTITDAVAAGLGDIDTSGHVGENDDGVKGGSGKIAAEAVTASITFGSATGTRDVTATGTSSTRHAHFGPQPDGTFNEDLPVNTVTVAGKITPLF